MYILVGIIILVCLFAIIVGIISRDHWNTDIDDKKEKQIIPSIKKSWHFDANEDVSTIFVNKPASNEYDPFYDTITTISAGNQYLDAHEELKISIFEKKLTEEKVNEAYEKLLDEHMRNIKKGKPTEFNIEDKKKAKIYLMEWLRNQK